MREEEEEEKKEAAPKAKAGPNIIVVILALLAFQALVAFLVVMFAIPKNEDDLRLAEERRNPDNEVSASSSITGEVVLPMRTEVIVNIAGTDGMRFLKAGIALAYNGRDNANKQLERTLLGMETQLRHKISEYLSSLTLTQVNDRSIRSIVSNELLSELNTMIPASAGRLSNVYVEEFIIQ